MLAAPLDALHTLRHRCLRVPILVGRDRTTPIYTCTFATPYNNTLVNSLRLIIRADRVRRWTASTPDHPTFWMPAGAFDTMPVVGTTAQLVWIGYLALPLPADTACGHRRFTGLTRLQHAAAHTPPTD